jgi:hypothetical protein
MSLVHWDLGYKPRLYLTDCIIWCEVLSLTASLNKFLRYFGYP